MLSADTVHRGFQVCPLTKAPRQCLCAQLGSQKVQSCIYSPSWLKVSLSQLEKNSAAEQLYTAEQLSISHFAGRTSASMSPQQASMSLCVR